MFLMKVSLVSALSSVLLFSASYIASMKLPEADRYRFPESIGRHYAAATGGSTEFGDYVNHEEKVELQNGSVPIREIEIETSSIDLEIESQQDPTKRTIEMLVSSQKVEKERPLLIDLSRGETLRVMTNEISNPQGRGSFMVFNFSDQAPQSRNKLLVRIPTGIDSVKIRSVSGDLSLRARPQVLHFQSKSGNLSIRTQNEDVRRINQLTVETVSGDLRGNGEFQALKFNSVSGDVKLTSWTNDIESISFQTVSGDFQIELESVAAREAINATVNFDSKSGHLKIDDREQKSRPLILGEGRAAISAVSVSGDFEIKTKNGDAD